MRRHVLLALLSICGSALLAGCATKPSVMSERECMARAMFFESNRSSEEGMVAVGTVVMNRVSSKEFPGTICGVVGQKNQFAPGVLSREMGAGRELAYASAAKVMRGARHAEVGGRSMFFHTAGYSFPYNNMHYVAIAGGNAFYEKRRDASVTQAQVRARQANRNAPSPLQRPAAASTAVPLAAALPQRAPAALADMTIEDVIRAQAGL